jgi:hypothetical protein
VVRWVGRAEYMGKVTNAYKSLVERTRRLLRKKPGIDESTDDILKPLRKKVTAWIGIKWLRIGTRGGILCTRQ